MKLKKPLKILRVAVDNVAGFPFDFCSMHNACGDESRLVTFHRNALGYREDICLDFPEPKGFLANCWKRKKEKDFVRNKIKPNTATIYETADLRYHYFKPKNIAEKIYFMLKDKRRKKMVNRTIKQYNLDNYNQGCCRHRFPACRPCRRIPRRW